LKRLQLQRPIQRFKDLKRFLTVPGIKSDVFLTVLGFKLHVFLTVSGFKAEFFLAVLGFKSDVFFLMFLAIKSSKLQNEMCFRLFLASN
jgi:hypothetical protein